MTERLPARSSFHGVTAETGLDALTHAVEAYIGRFYNTRESRSLARQAVDAIYRMNRALGIPECFPVFGRRTCLKWPPGRRPTPYTRRRRFSARRTLSAWPAG